MTARPTATADLSFARQAGLVLGGSILIALAAQISVPMWPVPMTLQTLAVLLVGLTLGARLGALSVLAYLAQGAAGLPVFAGGMNGAAFFGPTAGFLVGFVGVAYLAGFAADRGWTRRAGGTALVCLAASAALYLPGLLWPAALAQTAGLSAGWAGQPLGAYYWPYFVAPFLLGDAVKAVLAALILQGGRAALRRRTGG